MHQRWAASNGYLLLQKHLWPIPVELLPATMPSLLLIVTTTKSSICLWRRIEKEKILEAGLLYCVQSIIMYQIDQELCGCNHRVLFFSIKMLKKLCSNSNYALVRYFEMSNDLISTNWNVNCAWMNCCSLFLTLTLFSSKGLILVF